jgi:hypothetical protein
VVATVVSAMLELVEKNLSMGTHNKITSLLGIGDFIILPRATLLNALTG